MNRLREQVGARRRLGQPLVCGQGPTNAKSIDLAIKAARALFPRFFGFGYGHAVSNDARTRGYLETISIHGDGANADGE